VIVGIFRMCAAGFGLTAIAKCLNGVPGHRAELPEFFGGVKPPSPRHGSGSWAGTAVREILRRPRYIGQLVWGTCRREGASLGRVRRHPVVTVDRPDLRIVDQRLWDAVQARRKERATAYIRRTGGKLYGRPEVSRESRYLWSGFLQCAICGGAMVVGKKAYNPPRSWYTCSYHIKRGDTVCDNGVCAPVDALDSALLDGIETTLLSPSALRYVLGGSRCATNACHASGIAQHAPQATEPARSRDRTTRRSGCRG
jgi:hypothetical protein